MSAAPLIFVILAVLLAWLEHRYTWGRLMRSLEEHVTYHYDSREACDERAEAQLGNQS